MPNDPLGILENTTDPLGIMPKGAIPNSVKPQLYEALEPPPMGYEGLRGTSTIAPPQTERPIDSLTKEFKEKEAAPVSPYSQALSRGGKNVVNAAIDTLGMLPEGDDQKRYEYLKRTGHPQAERYNPVNKQELATFKEPLDPLYNPGEGLTKYAHDFVEMIPQIAGQIGTTLATGPVGGGAFMATQIAGPQYDSLVKQGVPKKRARIAALLNAAGQGALEQAGIVKALKSTNGGQIIGAMFTEWLTETMQKNPELATNIWATTEGKSNQERMEMFTSQWVDAMKEGAYEGLVAAPFGGLAATASTAAAGQQQPTGVLEPAKEQGFEHDNLETARVTPEQSLEVPSDVKPVVVGTPEQVKDIDLPEGKEVYQAGQKAYIMDTEAVHNLIGEDTPKKSIRTAKRMLRAGDDSKLLGKPSREGVAPEDLTTAAVTREGQVLTEPEQIKAETEAGNVIEAAEGAKEDVTAQAEKVSEAVRVKNAFAHMEQQVKDGEAGYRQSTQDRKTGDTKNTGAKSTYPDWFRKGKFTQKEFDLLMGKRKSGKFTPKQQARYLQLKGIAENLHKTDKEYDPLYDIDTITEQGFEPTTKDQVAGNFEKGDKFIKDGEVFTQKGWEDGQVVFKDGKKIKVDPWDTVDADGVKKQDVNTLFKEKFPDYELEEKGAYGDTGVFGYQVKGKGIKGGDFSVKTDAKPQDVVKAADKIIKGFETQQLNKKVKVPRKLEGTNKTVYVEVEAKTELADIDSRRTKLSKLMDCLSA